MSANLPNCPNSGIRDNHTRGSVADFLREKIQPGSHLSIVSAYFTIYAYDALKEVLDAIGHLDFLFGEPAFINRLDPDKTDKKAFMIDAGGLELANTLQQKRVAKACAEWIEQKVDIKTIRQSHLSHGKMYHVASPAGLEDAILGSSNFTVHGLGLGQDGNNIELNLIVNDNRDRADLKVWFCDLWKNETLVKDVKADVLHYLKKLYCNHAPQFIYYLTLFHLFRDDLDGTRDIDDDLRRVALPDTGIWNALFAFQKDGAKAAINKLLAYNGCILADSVGLGKTYTALAVIKYFELKNARVLVLCPKKLSRNWTVYNHPSTLNPFDKDRFRFDVLHHTDLSRDSGEVNGLDLATLNWGAYDLVVIDESHNFRNNGTARHEAGDDARPSRYQRLMADIISKGVRTQVLLLSATPVNNSLSDLRNQISFIAGGDVTQSAIADRALADTEKLGIASIADTTRRAQSQFTLWTKKPSRERKVRDLITSLGGDFFKLLDGLSIARSRRQIKKLYAAELERLGGFPERPAPQSVTPPLALDAAPASAVSFDSLNARIDALNLALFAPTDYLRDDLPQPVKDAYATRFNARMLVCLMRINILKRLESSVYSFRLTLERTLAKIDALLPRIEAFRLKCDAAPDISFDDLTPDKFEDPDFDNEELIGGKRRVHLGHIDLDRWEQAVRADRIQLQTLLDSVASITPAADGKLAELKRLIAEKVARPTLTKDGHPNRKVLVFTAFADTAAYLYANVAVGGASRPSSQTHDGRDAHPTRFIPYDPATETHRTRQHLPHWQKPGRTYFVTFRLADAIPDSKLAEWKDEVDRWHATHPEPWSESDRQEHERFRERKEQRLDAGHGSCILAAPDNRRRVESALRHFDGEHYILDEFAVMPNHVHVLVKPLDGHTLPDILHSWKSFTAHAIGKRIWQTESFDHIVRSWAQLEKFRTYIKNNPTPSFGASGRGVSPLTTSTNAENTDQIHTALVSGSGANRTTLGDSDFDAILTNFSPLSKRRAGQPRFPQTEEIDLLIATDCISEGQNLQDCDLLINYDIHWNPVRIIQRFGRIDRIGSRNPAVHLVNFWPVADLDRYLNVKNRVEARMALVDLSATQTDNLLDPSQLEDLIKDDLLFRNKQLKRLKDEILDLEDLDETVSLSDFSLDEFRLDLLAYLQANKEELEAAPLGLYAVVPPKHDLFTAARPGVLFCLRQKVNVAGAPRPCSPDGKGQDAPPTSLNPLAPHYLVYVHDDGTVRLTFAQPKETLALLRDIAFGEPSAIEKLCDLFDARTRDGTDMTLYSGLLQKALASIERTFQRRAAAGLTASRDFILPAAQPAAARPDDFELVTWLVILDGSGNNP